MRELCYNKYSWLAKAIIFSGILDKGTALCYNFRIFAKKEYRKIESIFRQNVFQTGARRIEYSLRLRVPALPDPDDRVLSRLFAACVARNRGRVRGNGLARVPVFQIGKILFAGDRRGTGNPFSQNQFRPRLHQDAVQGARRVRVLPHEVQGGLAQPRHELRRARMRLRYLYQSARKKGDRTDGVYHERRRGSVGAKIWRKLYAQLTKIANSGIPCMR